MNESINDTINLNCKCTKAGCERHGNCIKCKEYHENKGNLSYCKRPDSKK